MTADPAYATNEKKRDARYELGPTVEASALFVDVRKSSLIIDFVERHHGSEKATALFMDFLVSAMALIDGPSVYECSPSGDAVLALFTGETRRLDAIEAARRVLSFVRNDFLRDYRKYLTCLGECRQRHCPGVLEFSVGAGIDEGNVTPAQVIAGQHRSRQFGGACISYASKLSGVAPADSIVVSAAMFSRERTLSERYTWERFRANVRSIRGGIVRIKSPVQR